MRNDFYNDEPTEDFDEATIFLGNPNPLSNKSNTSHPWAHGYYRLGQNNTWYTGECDIAGDKLVYTNSTNQSKVSFDLTLAQLITNDSIQLRQLTGGIGRYITSPEVSKVLDRQAYEEAEHTVTYTEIADEVVCDNKRIYNLGNLNYTGHSKELIRKNRAVARLFNTVASGEQEPTKLDLLVGVMANLVLESLVFKGSFIVMWSFNYPGVNTAIAFIERDETGMHVKLFKMIFRTAYNELKLSADEAEEFKVITLDILRNIAEIEIAWLVHVSKGIIGFNERTITPFVYNEVNIITKMLKLPNIYDNVNIKNNPLYDIYNKNSKLVTEETGGGVNSSFFEKTPTTYSDNAFDEDY